jgi:ribonuclease E
VKAPRRRRTRAAKQETALDGVDAIVLPDAPEIVPATVEAPAEVKATAPRRRRTSKAAAAGVTPVAEAPVAEAPAETPAESATPRRRRTTKAAATTETAAAPVGEPATAEAEPAAPRRRRSRSTAAQPES